MTPADATETLLNPIHAFRIWGCRMSAFNQSDLNFIMAMRRATIEVTHDGRLQIRFEQGPEWVAKLLRDYIIKEADLLQE